MSKIPLQLLLQAVLIFLNAFFAMTEIAIISLSPAKLKKSAEAGDRKAKKLLRMVEEPAGFLSTIQIGITLAGFLGSAFAADNFSEYLVNWIYLDLNFKAVPLGVLDTVSVILITLILSYFTLILGELVPKRIAMQKPMQVARLSCGVVSAVAFVMKPVVWFLSASTNVVLRALRMKTEAEEETVTEEEIRMMVDIGEEKGTIESEEKEWIENVFEFGDTTARESMTHVSDVVALSLDMGREEILQIIRESGLSRFPVYQEDIHDIQGILYARDFLLNQEAPVKELLRPAYFVPENVKSASLFRDMQKKNIHLAVVVDEYGDVNGIVTLEDLLEEIVGNIYDEFDEPEPQEIERIGDNLWKVNGNVEMDAIAEALEIGLPEDLEYETLNGMVYSCLNAVPEDGAAVEVEKNGIHVHVTKIQNRRVEKAEIWKLEAAEGKAETEEKEV